MLSARNVDTCCRQRDRKCSAQNVGKLKKEKPHQIMVKRIFDIEGRKMQVKVLEKKPNELRMEIEGEDHSFCNVLQRTLLEDETIEMAGYNIPHPLVSNPIVYLRTKGQRRPETALKNAVEKIRKRNKEFRETFEKAMKEWQNK